MLKVLSTPGLGWVGRRASINAAARNLKPPSVLTKALAKKPYL